MSADEDTVLLDTVILDEQLPIAQIGKAASTIAGDKTAVKWANSWLKENEGVESIASLDPIHVEGDNMRRILRAMLNEFATSNVKYAVGTGFLKAESKRTYASKIKEAFREKFPANPFWNDRDEGWGNLYDLFNKAAQRFDQQGGLSTASKKSMPAYLQEYCGSPNGCYLNARPWCYYN
jgi:hypothetical protein